jgi:hypothetical protein
MTTKKPPMTDAERAELCRFIDRVIVPALHERCLREQGERDQPGDCHEYRPDHNGECLTCDEGIDAHTPEAMAAAERAATNTDK